MHCAAALVPPRWQVLVVGVSHGSSSSAEIVRRILARVRPSLVCLELDRKDFEMLRSSPEHDTTGAPECAAALRWVQETVDDQPGCPACVAIPIDRDQDTTRRRLMFSLIQHPVQMFNARRYWGHVENIDSMASLKSWQNDLRGHCAVLDEVVHEERDEFMTYRILTSMEHHLARHRPEFASMPSQRALTRQCHSPPIGLTSMDDLLQARAKTEEAHVNAALRRVLDDPRVDDSCAAPRLRVVVLCGPAHVAGLADRLAACLGDHAARGGTQGAHRLFLARNAASFPHLLASTHAPTPVQREDAAREAEHMTSTAELDFVSSVTTKQERIGGASLGLVVPVYLRMRMGPLTGIVERVTSWFSRKSEAVHPPAPLLNAFDQSVFAHERMRELSRRPLPVWPMMLTAYLIAPLLLFVVVPAKLDMMLLRSRAIPSQLCSS